MATTDKHPADGLVVMIMAVTGARLEEACGLLGGDVALHGMAVWLTIREGKTAAASRRIPVISPTVVDAIRLRLPTTPDLPLFPEYPSDRYHKRSKPVSQRLGRLLRKSVKDERVVAAHGWRHRGRDLAEKNGIEPWVADWFFGHARPGEGLGRYSRGPSMADLLRVAKAIPLPASSPSEERYG
jgi:integrase